MTWSDNESADIETARLRVTTRRAKIRSLIELAAEDWGVTFDQVMGKARAREVIHARFAAIALVRLTYPHLSLPQLGRLFNRDHTTMLNALNSTIGTKGSSPVRHRVSDAE